MSVNPDSVPAKPATPKALSLRANFSWTFAGNIANTLSQFGMLLALARLGSPEMTGQYGLALAITAPIFLLAGMSLRNVQVTDVSDEYSFTDYATIRVLGMLLGLMVVAVIVWLIGYSVTTATVVLLIGLSKAIEGLSDVIFGVFHKREQMDKIAKSMMVKAVVSMLVFAIVLWITDDLVWSVLSISIVWFLRLLAYDIPNLAHLRGQTSLSSFVSDSVKALNRIPKRSAMIVSLIMLSLPVGIASSLISLNTNIPRYVLEWTEGTAELGVFTVLAYPLAAGNIVISAVSQSSLPRLARYFVNGQITRFTALILRLLVLAIGLGFAAFFLALGFGEEVLRVLFGDEYAAEETTLLILVLGMGIGFLNWFLNSALHAMRAFRVMVSIQIGMLIVSGLMSIVLIPQLGLIGAAWLVVINLTIQVVGKTAVVYRSVRAAGKIE